ncbi:hypothetical protein POSPLADRAFT_1061231 [Postia placenta MAD-698-R-SB12]|uniref:Uncharacterized protein n=1 Tax=Postia placenta MAD-698-R-SB12 TaxID=670580 RepID=A0A1X6MMX0_9APHY|nr:hypothetical protein POSPLADRAFT_1061231 [Postia placenta MAD-698-R-SB12]OSX57532.1 hypothetical protein POSPLADRAFT_1061231 [Postia placenta MAD-698-R-SB12]
MEYPAPEEEDHDLPDVDPRLRSVAHVGLAPVDYPDLRKLNIWNRRLITSRKRTQNLYDLTNLWKKVVLQNLDELIANPPDMATYENPAASTNIEELFHDSLVAHTLSASIAGPSTTASPSPEPEGYEDEYGRPGSSRLVHFGSGTSASTRPVRFGGKSSKPRESPEVIAGRLEAAPYWPPQCFRTRDRNGSIR